MASFYTPPVRRKDSIGLIFSGKPDLRLINDVIFDKLRIDVDDLIGFQEMRNNKVILKFREKCLFETFLRNYEEKVISLANGMEVKIVNFSSTNTFVSIRYAPFDMENEALIAALSQYGKVFGIRQNTYTIGRAKGLLNGIRTAKMEVKKNIPSSLLIGGHNVLFMYTGQKRTCHKCGSEDHFAVNCSMDRIVEVFSLDNDFPSMGSSSEQSKKDGKNENQSHNQKNGNSGDTDKTTEVGENSAAAQTNDDTSEDKHDNENNQECTEPVLLNDDNDKDSDMDNISEIKENDIRENNNDLSEDTTQMGEFITYAVVHRENESENLNLERTDKIMDNTMIIEDGKCLDKEEEMTECGKGNCNWNIQMENDTKLKISKKKMGSTKPSRADGISDEENGERGREVKRKKLETT